MARRLNIEIAIDSRKAKAGGKEVEGALGGIGRQALTAAGALAAAGVAFAAMESTARAVGGFIGKASAEFATFDQALRNVGAVSGATREEIAALSEEALRLAKATRFSPEQTAQALYSLASAGQATKEQLSSLPAVLDFAEAAQADLGASTELIVSGLKAFSLEASDARRVADVFTASIGASAFNADRLQLAMRNAGPSAAAFGQELEGTVAASAALVNVMLSGERAGTGLRAVFNELNDKGEALGIATRNAAGEFRPLVDIIGDMETAGWDASRAVSTFGAEAGPALAVLLAQGADGLRAMEERLQSTGQAALVAGEQLDTLQGDIDQLASAQDEFWKVTGAQFEDGSRELVQTTSAAWSALTEIVKGNGDEISAVWSGSVDQMIASTREWAIVTAAVIDLIGGLEGKVGGLANALGSLPFVAVIADSLRIKDILVAMLDDTASGAGPAETAVRKFFDELETGANDAAGAVENLKRVSDYDAFVKPLAALGIDVTNTRDLDQLNRILAELEQQQAAVGVGMKTLTTTSDAATAAMKKQAEELARLRDRKRELATEVGQLTQALANQVEVWGLLDSRMAEFSSGTLEVPVPEIKVSDWVDVITEDALPEIQKEYEALFGNMQATLASMLSTALVAGILSGGDGAEDAFRNLGKSLSRVLEENLSDALERVFNQADGAWDNLSKLFQGGAGTALALGITASNIANANDQGYAAAGAAVGAALGAAIGAYFTGGAGAATGAKWGAVIGSWIGGMIKSGAPRFFGSLKEEAGKINLVGGLALVGGSMGSDIREGVEQLLSALGGELEGLGATIGLEMREGLAVTVDGIRTYFDSEHIGEGIQFAIVEALKNADISGISDEARAALNNTMADTMEELLSDLDFARWIEQLNLTDSAKALDDFVDEFRVAWDRMVRLGIDGADKLAQWAAKSLEDQRRSILGIQETAKERITREAQAFNQQLLIIKAEQEAKRAELMIQKAQLEANVSFLQAYGDIVGQRLELDGLLLKGERNLLQGKIGMLEAIDAALAAVDALLGSLPDLISNADIRKAINRAGRGAGGPTGPTQADRDAALLGMQDFGLSDAARQLAAATRFVQEHMQSIAELGFSEEELMEIRRKAQAEQDKLIRDLGRGALAALGTTSVGTIQRMQDLGLQLAFLRDNFEELGLKAWQVAAAAKELGEEITLSIAGGLAQYVEDADVRRQLQILEHDLFMRQKAIEIEAAHTMGLITQQQLEFLRGILDLAKEWKPPEVETATFTRAVRNTFSDARRDAERIAESFARAKGDLADFLNRVLVGEFGGVSPVGGVLEAQRQYDEVLRQAQTGNIGAIGELGDYGANLLRLARDTYASGPEFQAIRDYVLASGADILSLKQGREGNVVFDERFFSQGQAQLSEQQRMTQLLTKIEQHLSKQRGGAIVTGGVGG